MRALLDQLKREHQFNSWSGRNRLPDQLFIWEYHPEGSELPGWQMRNWRQMQIGPARRMIASVWTQPMASATGRILRLDAYECASRVAAHEFLIELLAQFTVPAWQRREELNVGDVVFSSHTDTGIVFARGNLVCALSSGGRESVVVLGLTQKVDAALVDKPAAARSETAHSRTSAGIAPQLFPGPFRLRVGELIPLQMSPAVMAKADFEPLVSAPCDPASATAPSYRLFSAGCDFLVQDGRIHLKALQAGKQLVEIYTGGQRGEPRRQSFEVEVTP